MSNKHRESREQLSRKELTASPCKQADSVPVHGTTTSYNQVACEQNKPTYVVSSATLLDADSKTPAQRNLA